MKLNFFSNGFTEKFQMASDKKAKQDKKVEHVIEQISEELLNVQA